SCAECHTTTSWQGATLAKHRFPIDHGKRRTGGGNNACKVCHPATTNFVAFEKTREAPSYSTYTCYGCHAHTQEREARRHERRKVTDLAKCASCHKNPRSGRRQAREDFPGIDLCQGCPEVAGAYTLTSCPSVPDSHLEPLSPRVRIAEPSVP